MAKRLNDNPSDVSIVLDRARAEFCSWMSRYESYVGFLEMFDPVIKEFRKLEAKLDETIPKPKRKRA